MGAEYFEERVKASSAKEAFAKAQEQAWWDHGHAGYTGTIAEKPGFVLFAMLADETPEQAMERLADTPEADDKWANCACIQPEADEFIFFGWASA